VVQLLSWTKDKVILDIMHGKEHASWPSLSHLPPLPDHPKTWRGLLCVYYKSIKREV
jgi:hypothetical protein